MSNEGQHLDDHTVADEVRAAREEYADEEAEAAEIEAAQNAAALDVPLSMRITRNLDMQLRQRAAAEHISPSALVRRLLHDALEHQQHPALTVEQVEEIARRVMRESA
jgi:predicted DNA binding CopG/RHH family protein